MTRSEMKDIMAGGQVDPGSRYCKTGPCSVYDRGMTFQGSCSGYSGNNMVVCYCASGAGDYNVGNYNGMSNCFL
jgi:hypothetical protein